MKNKIISVLLVITLIFPTIAFTGCAETKKTGYVTPTNTEPLYEFADNVKTFVREDIETPKKNAPEGTKFVPVDTTFKLVEERGDFEFYFCEESLEIALKNKTTGETWYSNPTPSERSAGILSDMSSQLTLFYFDKSDGSQKTLYSYDDCLNESTDDKKQYYIVNHYGHLRVIYVLGRIVPDYVVPTCLVADDLNKYADMFAASEKHSNIAYRMRNGGIYTEIRPEDWEGYSLDVKQPWLDIAPLMEQYIEDGKSVYVFNQKLLSNAKEMKKIQAAFVEVAEMTLEQRNELNDKFGYVPETAQTFWIPVDYELTDTGLRVTIPNEEIQFDKDNLSLVSIDLLKYFGSASQKEEGYMFVPDGSGAIVNFNNGKTNITSDIRVQLYGLDDGRESLTKPYANESAYLPVFGIKRETSAMFAVIESGDTNATVVADIAGKNANAVDRNRCYTSFRMSEYDEIQFKSAGKKSKIYQYNMNSADLKIHYTILNGDKANYSGMAEFYRNYLIDKGAISKKNFSNVPFNIELVGAYDHETAFLGIPYTETKAITTFAQCKEILAKLKEAGITNVSVNYKGWANNGLRNTVFNKAKVLKELGGKKGLQDLLTYAKSLGVNLYFETELAFVYENSLFSGYNEFTMSSRLVTRNVAYHYQYLDDWNTAAQMNAASIVSPTVIYNIDAENNSKSFAMKLLKDINKLGINAVSLGSLGYNLPGNYKIKDFSDREKVSKVYSAVAKKYSETLSVMAKGTNSYMLPYVTEIFEISNTSSKFNLADMSVPFYQMVIHGCIEYSGDPINLDGDTRQVFLQAVEAGAGMYYRWCYAPNDQVQELWFEGMYSLSYESWLNGSIQMYKEYNNLLASTAGSFMVNHEYVDEDIVKVTYENGVAVYVNYSSNDYTADDGTIVKAESFAKGGVN